MYRFEWERIKRMHEGLVRQKIFTRDRYSWKTDFNKVDVLMFGKSLLQNFRPQRSI